MKFTADEEGKVWETVAYRIPQIGESFIEEGSITHAKVVVGR